MMIVGNLTKYNQLCHVCCHRAQVVRCAILLLDTGDGNRRSRRRGDRHDRDRPLPPLLARVGGNIEVSDALPCLTLLAPFHCSVHES